MTDFVGDQEPRLGESRFRCCTNDLYAASLQTGHLVLNLLDWRKMTSSLSVSHTGGRASNQEGTT
jgi:hypothetical protein